MTAICQLFTATIPAWAGSVGLLLDVIGVLLLGFDLIRVQRGLRAQARRDLEHFDGLANDYGGTESWIEEIERSAKWISSHQYEDRHAEDEVSFNARRSVEQLNELSQCIAGVAEHLGKVVELQRGFAEGNRVTANASLYYSFVGLILIFVGFSLQLVAAVKC